MGSKSLNRRPPSRQRLRAKLTVTPPGHHGLNVSTSFLRHNATKPRLTLDISAVTRRYRHGKRKATPLRASTHVGSIVILSLLDDVIITLFWRTVNQGFFVDLIAPRPLLTSLTHVRCPQQRHSCSTRPRRLDQPTCRHLHLRRFPRARPRAHSSVSLTLVKP